MTVYEYGDQAIPKRMRPALDLYVSKRKPVGHFLRAVFSNDFIDAVTSADEENGNNLRAYGAFLCSVEPSTCHGSSEAYHAWIKGQRTRAMPIPEPGEKLEVTITIKYADWVEMVAAVEMLGNFIGRGRLRTITRIADAPQSEWGRFADAVEFVKDFLKKEITGA